MLAFSWTDAGKTLTTFWQTIINNQGVTLALIIIAIILFGYRLLTKQLSNLLTNRVIELPNRQQIMTIWREFWMVGGTVLIVIALSGSLVSLGVSLGFMVAALGVAMHRPVTSFLAWIVIQFVKPFKIGDRIVVGNLNPIEGEVIGITVWHTILKSINEGPIIDDQEERRIFVNNNVFFDQQIQCSKSPDKIIKDIIIFITSDSDLEIAEQLIIYSLVNADSEKEIDKTKTKLWVEPSETAVKITLRCLLPKAVARDLASTIYINIVENFQRNTQVKLKS